MPSLSAKASQGTNEISIIIKLPWSHLLEMMWNKYVSEVFLHAQSTEPNFYSLTLQPAGNWSIPEVRIWKIMCIVSHCRQVALLNLVLTLCPCFHCLEPPLNCCLNRLPKNQCAVDTFTLNSHPSIQIHLQEYPHRRWRKEKMCTRSTYQHFTSNALAVFFKPMSRSPNV